MVFWFQAAYAVAYLVFGRVVDRIGARWGYRPRLPDLAVAHMAHAAARSLGGFMAARFWRWASAKAGGFPGAASRRWPSGSPSRSAPSPPACSTPAPISARSSRRWWSRPIAAGLRLARGLRRDRPGRPRLAADLAAGLPHARASTRASAPPSWPTSRAIRRTPSRPRSLAPAADSPRDLGLRAGQVPDRPDLVDVPVLAAGLPRASATAWT